MEKLFAEVKRDIGDGLAQSYANALKQEIVRRTQEGMFPPSYCEMPKLESGAYATVTHCQKDVLPWVLVQQAPALASTPSPVMPVTMPSTGLTFRSCTYQFVLDLCPSEYPFFIASETHGAQLVIVTNFLRIFLLFDTASPAPPASPSPPASAAVPTAPVHFTVCASQCAPIVSPNRQSFEMLLPKDATPLPSDYIHFAVAILGEASQLSAGPTLCWNNVDGEPVSAVVRGKWCGVICGQSRASVVAAYAAFLARLSCVVDKFWMRNLIGPAAIAIRTEHSQMARDLAAAKDETRALRELRAQFELEKKEFYAQSGQRAFAQKQAQLEEAKRAFEQERHMRTDQMELRKTRMALRILITKNKLLTEELASLRRQFEDLTCDASDLIKNID